MIKKRMLAVALFVALVSSCTRSRQYGPPQENVYRYPAVAKVTSLDPHQTSDVYSLQAQGLTYESLYQYHFLKKPLTIIPALAEGMPETSKDFKTWTFRLKKGIRYQDDPCFKATQGKGREMTVKDFLYYFKRVANRKRSSPVFSSFEKIIVGIDDFRAGTAKEISGLKEVDGYTLKIELLKPQPRFIYNFTTAASAFIPQECDEFYADQISQHAIGTGPWMIKSYSALKVVAEKNPNFRQEVYPSEGSEGDKEKGLLTDAGQTLPFIDKVIIEVMEQDQPRWLRFEAGEFEQAGIPKDNMQSALPSGKLSDALKAKGIQHYQGLSSDIVADIFNLDDPVWGKKKILREAVALARDVPRFIEMAYTGFAVPAGNSVLNPGVYGYQPDRKPQWMTRNLKKAKALLAEAGYSEGKGLPPIVYPTGADSTHRQFAEFMKRNMDEVGIPLQIEPMAWPEFIKRLKEGKFTLGSLGWAGDVPDPDSSLPMYHTRALPPFGQNYIRLRSHKFDQLVEDIEFMGNGPARLKKIHEAIEFLDNEFAFLPIAHRIMNTLYQPWVKNATLTDVLQVVPFLKYRRVEWKK